MSVSTTYLVVLLGLFLTCVWGFALPISSLAPLSSTCRYGRNANDQSLLFRSREHAETERLVTSAPSPQNFSVTFPSSCRELLQLRPGEHVKSDTFAVEHVGKTHDFCVLLYPRGGGHSPARKLNSGFGMSYRMFEDKDPKVGVYLQYLPSTPQDTVDATFTLLLKGKQTQRPRFDLKWSAGMRFCSSDKTNLREGMANDFGAHLMQTKLLPVFLGAEDETASKLEVQVNITVHHQSFKSLMDDSSSQKGLFSMQNIRQIENNGEAPDQNRVRVGKIVVPVLQRLQQRPRMFELGAYPGVEYRIMRIFDKSGMEVFVSEPNADYELKPIYPLVDQLERPWPVRVNEKDIPKLLTAGMYNTILAIGSLLTAFGGLTVAFLISQAVSLFVIPSRSMDPTLQVNDVLLVEKVTPRILGGNKRIGDIVLFSPPTRLREIVSSSGGRITDRDLFVKRIAAGPGDVVTVDSSGNVRVDNEPTNQRRDMCGAEPLRLIEKYIQPGDIKIYDRQVFVLGDCSSVSIDSRVWGSLELSDIVGRPLLRIWPLERFGPVPSLSSFAETEWAD